MTTLELTPNMIGRLVTIEEPNPPGSPFPSVRFSGMYLGVALDEEDGVPYHYFLGGEINGTPQGSHGHPAGSRSEVTTSKTPTALITEAKARVARCTCGRERPSDPSLPFFEYRGEGSASAHHCVCGYAECAHDPDYMEVACVHGPDGKRRPTVVEQGRCDGFTPRGAWDHDTFYCGCRGWD
jgi:hypothetical protein